MDTIQSIAICYRIGMGLRVILHGGASGPLLLAWDFEPYLILLLVFAAGLYGLGLRRIAARGVRSTPRTLPVCFYSGLIAAAIAISGPVETLNENSFTLHMAQHVIMMLVAAPLLVLGRPFHVALWALEPELSGAILRPVLRQPWLRGALTGLAHPITVLLLINLNLVLWHLPAFYVAALENRWIHELEHSLFFGTAALFWWVIIDPVPRHHRVKVETAILMLFVAGSVGDLLALYLIFSPDVLYPYYLGAESVWGMSQITDQRVGGAVMLIAGTTVYFGTTFLLIVRNYGNTAPNEAHREQHVIREASEPAQDAIHADSLTPGRSR